MKKKALSLVLALVMCLSLIPMQAFADESTTTITDAAPDKLPNTEIYTVTKQRGDDYPYFGAKYEPQVGVYYGRTCLGGTKPNGQFGLVNEDQLANESAVGFYFDTTQSYSLEYWNYLYGPAVNDGSRAFLVYINFAREGNDCAAYASGQYDSLLTEAFSYLNTLSNPVFIRIGGEMNVWTTPTEPQDFIAAFRHVADLAHRIAPNVATVFSPNYASLYQGDMDSFYPGDAYVDWIGISLYYNAIHPSNPQGTDANDRFLGAGPYGDALLNVQQGVNLSRLHQKPLMATEGGSANAYNGRDISDEAAARMEKAFAFLPMVYPELKCIITSDYNPYGPNAYKFYDNSTVTAAYRWAVANNPTYLSKVGGDASYYTKLSAFNGTWTGRMRFDAYTYTHIGDKPTATWSVDGQVQKTVSEYPYTFELDVDSLGAGEHTLTVTFSNGQSKSYAFTANSAGTRPAASFSFADVPAGEWYAEPVKWAVEQGITNGTSTTTFSPNAVCTETQILIFLWRAMGQPVSTFQLPFTLDPSLSYAEGALRWASEKYMIGSGFNQNAPCTRASAVRYIWQAKGRHEAAYNGQFTDVAATHGDAQAVAWAVNAGITDGTGTNPPTFSPNDTCTRGQIMTFLYRAYN